MAHFKSQISGVCNDLKIESQESVTVKARTSYQI